MIEYTLVSRLATKLAFIIVELIQTPSQYDYRVDKKRLEGRAMSRSLKPQNYNWNDRNN